MLKYTIADKATEKDILTEYGVHVSSTTGLLGRPDFKNPTKFNWDYLNGEWIDLGNRRYKPREITMKCWLKANNEQQAIDKMNTFFKVFSTSTLLRLHIEFINASGQSTTGTKGLFYLVYLSKTGTPRYKWRASKQVIEFTLTLIEPSPVKRVYKVVGTDSGTVTIAYTCASELDIHWGDGDVTYDCVGTDTVTHEYGSSGTYYLIITGVIGDISSMALTTSTGEITTQQLYEEI